MYLAGYIGIIGITNKIMKKILNNKKIKIGSWVDLGPDDAV